MKFVTRRKIAVGMVGSAIVGAANSSRVQAAINGVVGNRTDALITSAWQQFWSTFSSEQAPNISNLPDTKQSVRTLFGENVDGLKIVGGHSHHAYRGKMHPDDQWACSNILDYARVAADASELKLPQPEKDCSGSYICVGSPVSNSWSRVFLEYDYIDARRPKLGFYRNERCRIKLPFQFALSQERINRIATHRIHEAERGRTETNWSIVGPGNHYLVPNTCELETDFLLITQIPNWIDLETSRTRKPGTITLFAGTHGVGTAALRHLFSDLSLLKKLLLRSAGANYWQALFVVRGMTRSNHPFSPKKRLVSEGLDTNFYFEKISI
jgi:hypothetical protein